MRKKRITALLMAMTVAVSACLTGCGNTGSDSTSKEESTSKTSTAAESSKETASVEEVQEELDPVTLKVWIPAAKTEDSDLVLEKINEHLTEVLPNTTLEIEWVALSEWKDKWSKAMAAQEVIDLSWFGYTNSVETEIGMGSLMPIDDLLTEYGSGIIETLGEPVIELHRSLDDQLYFVPAWQGLLTNRYAIYFPHDVVELLDESWAEDFQATLYKNWEAPCYDAEAKMESVAYIDELLEAAKANDMLNLGFYMRMDPLYRIFMTNSNNGTGDLSSALYVCLVDDTYYVQADTAEGSPKYYITQTYHEWYEKGYIREDVLSVEEGNVKWTTDLPREQTYVNYCHNGLTDTEHLSYSDTAGYQIDGFYFAESAVLGKGFATGAVVPATSANPERAMMFLELLYTDVELYQLLVYGIEGTHYTSNSDGTITYAENKTYTGPSNWTVGTCMNSLQTNPDKLDYYQGLKDAEEYARISILEGFTFDKKPVSVELSNLSAVGSEYDNATLCVSDDWEGLLKQRRDKMIAAGLETVLNEYCEQLSEYAAEKGMKVVNMGY